MTDVYWEFSFVAPVVLFIVGLWIGRVWRRSGRSVSAFVLSVVIVSVAPYIVAQDLMDSGFRILFMTIPAVLLFKFFLYKQRQAVRVIRHTPITLPRTATKAPR